jgi:hypothetical protein
MRIWLHPENISAGETEPPRDFRVLFALWLNGTHQGHSTTEHRGAEDCI